jgi:hypothetical protein
MESRKCAWLVSMLRMRAKHGQLCATELALGAGGIWDFVYHPLRIKIALARDRGMRVTPCAVVMRERPWGECRGCCGKDGRLWQVGVSALWRPGPEFPHQ